MSIKDASNLPDDKVPEWVRQSRIRKREKRARAIAPAKSALQDIICDPSLSFDETVQGLRDVIKEGKRLLAIAEG